MFSSISLRLRSFVRVRRAGGRGLITGCRKDIEHEQYNIAHAGDKGLIVDGLTADEDPAGFAEAVAASRAELDDRLAELQAYSSLLLRPSG
jgi:hypothetical protein